MLGPLVGALALAGCGLVRGSPKDREIVVTLAVSRSEAIRRTLATFREQGYRVRETLTSGANPVTEEFRHRDDADAVFRAAITGSAQSSRIVLSGTYRRLRLGGLMHDDERPIRNTDDDDVERELWARLSNLASTLGNPRALQEPHSPPFGPFAFSDTDSYPSACRTPPR